MAKDPKRQKAERYKGWLTPKRAIETLKPAYDYAFAKTDLYAKLKAGLLVSYAAKIYGANDYEVTHVEISASVWREVDSLRLVGCHFWETGNFITEIHVGNMGISLDGINYIGVRFDPEGIKAILDEHGISSTSPIAEMPTQEIASDQSSPPANAVPKETRPKAEPAHLKAWFDAYQSVYSETDLNTLDFAWESAKGMFPDKWVIRDRVHEMFSDRKPGPRKKGR
jgi:hypothetical protein